VMLTSLVVIICCFAIASSHRVTSWKAQNQAAAKSLSQMKDNVESGRKCTNIYPQGSIATDCLTVESARCYCQNAFSEWGTTFSQVAYSPNGKQAIKFLKESHEKSLTDPASVCPRFEYESTVSEGCKKLCPTILKGSLDYLEKYECVGSLKAGPWPQCLTPSWTTELKTKLGLSDLRRYAFQNKEIDGLCAKFVADELVNIIKTLPKLKSVDIKVDFNANTANYATGKEAANNKKIAEINGVFETYRDAINKHLESSVFGKNIVLTDEQKPSIFIMGVSKLEDDAKAGKLAFDRIRAITEKMSTTDKRTKLATNFNNMKFEYRCYSGEIGIYVMSKNPTEDDPQPPIAKPKLIKCV